ncbi:M protein repeat protein [Cooperia oncophora]
MLSEPSPIAVASEDVEELQGGDIQSGSSDRMMDGGVSARYSAIPRYMSPILEGGRRATISRESSVPRSYGSEMSSPTPSQRRKYNMNDSEYELDLFRFSHYSPKCGLYYRISFMIHEIKVLHDEEQRRSKSPAEGQLKENLAQLQAERAELYEDLRAISAELDKFKQQSAEQDSALAETNKKLMEMERAKEHAERSVADYEFIVTDLKKRHNKQKEDLHAKLFAQEEELERLRAAVHAQADLTCTSAGLSTELALANEQLLVSEAARAAAQKRCEELAEELDEATKSAVTSMALSEEVSWISILKVLVVSNFSQCYWHYSQVTAANRDLAAMRSRLAELEKELLDREEAMLTANRRHAEECAKLQQSLEEISLFNEMSQMKSLKEKCSAFEEQLETEKLARDVANREIMQLRDENYTVTEALNKASNALMDAESRAAAAEKHLTDHIKCHTEELNLRVTELEKMVAAGLADKQALTSELEEKIEKQTALTNEVKKAGEVISKLETEVTDAQKEKTALMEEVKLGKQLYEEKAAEAEKSALKSLEGERDNFKEQLLIAVEKAEKNEAISKKVVESLEAEIAALTAERDALKNSLAAVEDHQANLEKNLAELKECMSESQAEVAKLTTMSVKMEEEWKEREQVYKEKITAAEEVGLISSFQGPKYSIALLMTKMDVEAIKKVPQLENTIGYLKSEAEALDQEIREKNSMLDLEVMSRQKATTALAALEEKYLSLQEAKKEVEKEYEKAKKQFDSELSAAQKVVDELKEAMAMLEGRMTAEETSANEKIEAATAEIARLDAELRKSKAAQAEAELEMTRHRQKAEEAMERYMLLESKLAEACSEESKQNSKAVEAELKELKRVNELQSKEIDRLGDLCDEFDEIEANYRQKVFTLIRERDQLKALLEPVATAEVPNLRAALTDGVQMLTPETTLTADNMAETRLKELEKVVEKLTEDNRRLEQLRTIEDTKMAKEIEELRRRCRLQENRIAELEKVRVVICALNSLKHMHKWGRSTLLLLGE